jgi:NTP pyrophosphatase (non-canonical NTP hydrolase)
MTEDSDMSTARTRAREVRELYEALEHRLLGRTWTTPELALGFTHDAAYVGRLVLAAERTWDIAGDTEAEIRHKLAECLWWVFVLADRLDVDLPQAYEATMGHIRTNLSNAVEGGGGVPR